MDKDTVKYYKELLCFTKTARIICDVSYIKFLASCVKRPIEILDTHDDVLRVFHVKHVHLDSTWCVLEEIKADYEEAYKAWVIAKASRSGEREAAEKLNESEHLLRCTREMRCFVCSHRGARVGVADCLEEEFRKMRDAPYMLASNDKVFYMKMQESTCLPVLSVSNGRQRILYPASAQKDEKKAARNKAIETGKKITEEQQKREVGEVVKRKKQSNKKKKQTGSYKEKEKH